MTTAEALKQHKTKQHGVVCEFCEQTFIRDRKIETHICVGNTFLIQPTWTCMSRAGLLDILEFQYFHKDSKEKLFCYTQSNVGKAETFVPGYLKNLIQMKNQP